MAQTTSNTHSDTKPNRGTDGRIIVGIVAALTAALVLAIMDAVAYNLLLTYGVIETQLIRNVAGVMFLVALALLRREQAVVPWLLISFH